MIDLDFFDRARTARAWIYVSGPMTKKPYLGPRDAMRFATRLWRVGWQPIVPQLCSIWEMVAGELDADSLDGVGGWMEQDLSLMTRCEAITRMPGPSSGADREIAVAGARDILNLTMEQALLGPDAFLEWDACEAGSWARRR